MKSEKTNAKLIFDAQMVEMWLDSELDEIFADPNDDEFCVAKLWFDWYDESFELKFDKLFVLSPEQIEKFYKLLTDNGFTGGWINFPNKEDELVFNFREGPNITKKITMVDGKLKFAPYP